jgi:outer membrane protein OmpA-like peptidoglycan-associated protein
MEGAMRRWALAITALAATVGLAGGLAACQTGPKTRADLVMSENPCVDSHFIVYFNEGSNRLTRPATQLISETGKALKSCQVSHARVLGLADATGTPEANRSLSQRRAAAVADALRRQGIPSPQFEVAAAGEEGATTADGREAPVRRQAEVYLTVTPK